MKMQLISGLSAIALLAAAGIAVAQDEGRRASRGDAELVNGNGGNANPRAGGLQNGPAHRQGRCG